MKMARVALILFLTSPAFAAAEDWNNVSIMDSQCAAKGQNPDTHARSCALICAKTGYGIVDKDGHYLKFDQNGNQQAKRLLETSTKSDHLRVDVQGKKDGETIHVESLKML